MTESATAVALLFDDQELVGQLRDALRERGARIVHEGALSTFSREMLIGTGAEVVVVNLDEDADEDLDRLHDVIEGDRPRVVFNDAQASRRLDGWDRARWARHLAVKVMAQGDLDPPRPQDAPQVPVVEEAELAATPVEAVDAVAIAPAVTPDVAIAFEPVTGHDPLPLEGTEAVAESESLAAELEALLAADEPLAAEDDFGTGLKFAAEDELPPLHDGHFDVDALMTQGPAPVEPAGQDSMVVAMPSFQLDHLALAPLDESFMPAAAASVEAPELVRAPSFSGASSWALVEDDEVPVATAERAMPFNIEKLSAAEFLAPDGGDAADSAIEPGMSLELVSIEEAIAPVISEGSHEMLLDDLDVAIGRILVLGAAADSTDAVCAFLSRLPGNLRMTVLHVQHLGGKPVDALAEKLAQHSALPVQVAAAGVRARAGEVLVVPEHLQARVYRDGRVDLRPLDGEDMQSLPIDASFTMAANVFGRSAQAIVFAGHANDAVGGCQAIHDRGGQVWVEASMDGHFADMVSGIEAERLSSYSGTPAELAARLVEEMSMEGRR
ncbi:chemotaxis protein CheB [Dyella soli]|uniref:protein-glutamate methylesterase n=1 Tax=Dyella soli TaxID=522319 RepID=A0A4R0YQ60_9GAMM|nr:chemotaxis protein CheB [Dyella soli]TCI10986.1 chemotaxis protein CheB [Dyella soli]